MTTDAERVRDAYNRIAGMYALRTAEMPPALIKLADEFLALLPPDPRVLDLGCGAGRDMAWLEARGARVTGVDLSTGMLEEARRRVRGELLQMDMRRLSFPDGHFHGVWCMASMLHLPKAEAPLALGEVHRVLVPGGALALSVQEGEGERWESGPYDPHVERFFARCNYSALSCRHKGVTCEDSLHSGECAVPLLLSG
ncbi:MAG: class I SAM-dependent methyltransferase [Chloroflexota bacterium]|nr:class I SAM-dependent methyltransferase [Chloroflexota bacterium]